MSGRKIIKGLTEAVAHARGEVKVRERISEHQGDVKVERAPDVAGKAAWFGLYWRDGTWLTVRNDSGNPISYADRQAAARGALFMSHEKRK